MKFRKYSASIRAYRNARYRISFSIRNNARSVSRASSTCSLIVNSGANVYQEAAPLSRLRVQFAER